MKIDLYTKFILTVIAISLVIIALQPLIMPLLRPSPVFAQPESSTFKLIDNRNNTLGTTENPIQVYVQLSGGTDMNNPFYVILPRR